MQVFRLKFSLFFYKLFAIALFLKCLHIFALINKKNGIMNKLYFLAALTSVATLVASCDSDDDPINDDEIRNEAGDYEFNDKSVNGKSFYASYEELRLRLLFGLADPNAPYNDPERIYQLIGELGESQSGLRGSISQIKAGYDFYKAMENATAIPRCAALGVIKKAGIDIRDNKVMVELFSAIDAKHLPSNYNAKDFWADFSTGKLDRYAPAIFKDIYTAGALSGAEQRFNCEAFQNYCDKCNIRPIDLALTAAPRLISAGASLVIANSDDLIQWGENAYNFINDNGELLISFADGNLDGTTLSKACTTNFKLLTTALKSTLSDLYDETALDVEKDFLDIFADWTQEQVSDLNKLVNEYMQDELGNTIVFDKDQLAVFSDRIKEIVSPKNDLEEILVNASVWMNSYEDENGKETHLLKYNANHTGVSSYILPGGGDKEFYFSWSLDGDQLTMNTDDGSEVITSHISYNNGALTIKATDGSESIVYTEYK